MRSRAETGDKAEPFADAMPAAVAPQSTAAENGVRKAVAQAWSAVLGPAAIAKNLTWEDAGGDLISALRLWFNLEEALGVQLPLDVVGPDAKLDDVVVAVEQALGLRARRLGHDFS